jgi:hypothetical protein
MPLVVPQVVPTACMGQMWWHVAHTGLPQLRITNASNAKPLNGQRCERCCCLLLPRRSTHVAPCPLPLVTAATSRAHTGTLSTPSTTPSTTSSATPPILPAPAARHGTGVLKGPQSPPTSDMYTQLAQPLNMLCIHNSVLRVRRPTCSAVALPYSCPAVRSCLTHLSVMVLSSFQPQPQHNRLIFSR